MEEVRIAVRVKPGASRLRVGGSYGPDAELIVSVNAPPVDGAANEAVLDAVAEAFDLRRREVRLVSGRSARSKVVALGPADGDTERIRRQLAELLD